MLLKEIFSKKKRVFGKILDQKTFNHRMYEKSYIRGLLIESNSLHSLDNNSFLFNIKKKSNIKKRRRKIKRAKKAKKFSRIWTNLCKQKKKRRRRHGYKGSSSYTTTSLYKNRKNNFIRFQLPLCNTRIKISFIDSFLEGLRKLITGNIKKKGGTLILLNPRKGGFICYSSGFRGFLPKKEFEYIILLWINKAFKRSKQFKLFKQMKHFIKSQKFNWSICPPPRFRFNIKTIAYTFHIRRKKFVLSRKKRSYVSTKMLPSIVFYSTLSSSLRAKLDFAEFELMLNDKSKLPTCEDSPKDTKKRSHPKKKKNSKKI